MTERCWDYPSDRLALSLTPLRPGHVSPLTRAAYRNHEHVEVSAAWAERLSSKPHLPGNRPGFPAKIAWTDTRKKHSQSQSRAVPLFKYTTAESKRTRVLLSSQDEAESQTRLAPPPFLCVRDQGRRFKVFLKGMHIAHHLFNARVFNWNHLMLRKNISKAFFFVKIN